MSSENKEQKNHLRSSPENISSGKPHTESDNIVFYNNDTSQKNKQSLPQRTVKTNKKPAGNTQDVSNSKQKPKPASVNAARKGKLSKKRVAVNVVASVFSVLFIIAGILSLVAYTYFHRIKYEALTDINNETNSNNIEQQVSRSETSKSQVETYSGNLLEDPMVLNIMLFGADTRKGAEKGNSDTMVLFSIDTRHKKMKMLSFMRDTYVDIPGHGENRINASYTLGGASLSVSTIQKNYGIKVDRYAVVDFSSFREIINILGGIDVELTSEEVDYINWQSWINDQDEYKEAEGDYKEAVRSQLRGVWLSNIPEYEKPINKDSLSFTQKDNNEPTAIVHLDGRQALWHARNRGEDGICSGDDFTRTQRQRNVLSIIINDMKKADIGTVMSVIYEIGPLITTNVKTSEITALASNISKYLSYEIISESAPLVNEIGSTFFFSDNYERPVYINGELSSVILINDWNDFRRKIAEFIFEDQVQSIKNSG